MARSWAGPLPRVLFVTFLIGTALSISSTGTVSVNVVLGTTLAWSFIVLVQLLAIIAIAAPAPGRTVTLSDAIDAALALHAPWSLWILASIAWIWLTSPIRLRTGLLEWAVPFVAAWTAFLMYRFCRSVLRDSHRTALLRVGVHQGIIWGAALIIGGAAVGFWPRIVRLLQR